MAKRGSGLAARFRKAIVSESEAKEQAEAARKRAEGAAKAARDELLRDLAEFGRELGFARVHLSPTVVTLTHGQHRLRFTADDGTGVNVTFEGQGDEVFRLYREPQLANRWIFAFTRRKQEHRLPLFDQGLEELLVLGLGLPRPAGDGDDEEPDLPPKGRHL